MCAAKAASETARWVRSYQKALSKHLAQNSAVSMQPAVRLGRHAAKLGLETLDVARIHEQALLSLVSPDGAVRLRQKMIGRAKNFFTETIIPIEKTHPAALQADIRAHELTRTLRRCTRETSASKRNLKQGIARRQAAEAALKESGKHLDGLLQESTRLQNRLRDQTHGILSALENERQKNSRRLHGEITQMLLAINIRLLTLKTSARAGTENLKKEIAGTRRLVKQSVKTIHRLAYELDDHHEP